MPTDEDRREVAARLRNWESFRETFMESPICAVIDALGVEDYLDWRGVFELLADLIEPEPERTCEGHRCEETDEWVCHKCGGSLAGCMFDPVRDGFVCVPNFCPSCGAKVVS